MIWIMTGRKKDWEMMYKWVGKKCTGGLNVWGDIV